MIKDLLVSLNMQGAINVLTDLEKVSDREEFLIRLLQAEKNFIEKKEQLKDAFQALSFLWKKSGVT